MKRVLVIGGPDDGRRRNIQPFLGHIRQIVNNANVCVPTAVPPTPLSTPGFGIETYSIMQYKHADGTVSEIAVHSSVKNIMKQLVKGYHYHRNPRKR